MTVRKLCIGGVFLLALCAFGRAKLPAESIPSGTVWLTEGWRYHAGDNAGWADPGFDDTGWELHNPQKQTDSCSQGCWYRLHIELPPHGQTPLTLLVLAQSGVFEAYIDGHRTGSAHFEPWWLVRETVEFLIPLPDDRDSFVLAIRVHPPRVAFDANEAAFLRVAIGGQQSIQDAADAHRMLRVTRFLPSGAINLALVLAGLALLLVFFLLQHHREYFWLSLYLMILGASCGVFTASV
jgi:hypothetical protein